MARNRNNQKQDIQISDNTILEAVNNEMSDSIKEISEKKIKTMAKELEAQVKDLSLAEQTEFYKQTLLELGIPKEKLGDTLPQGWEASEIVKSLGVYVIEQSLKRTFPKFGWIDSLVGVKQYQNGQHQIFYSDFGEIDNLSGFSDVEISDYNQGSPAPTFEVYGSYLQIHKGLDLYMNMLNDTTKTDSLFVSLLKDIAYYVSTPIQKAHYKLKLRLLVNPLNWNERLSINTPLDMSKAQYTHTISASSAQSLLEQLQSLINGINDTPSRNHNLPEKFKPQGFDKFQMINPTNLKLIYSTDLDALIKNQAKAGAYQLDQLKIPAEVIAKNFEKTFIEFGDITGLLNGTEDSEKPGVYEYTAILTEANVSGLIQHYEGVKQTDTPKLKSVINMYERLGHELDKNKYWALIKIRIKLNLETEKV